MLNCFASPDVLAQGPVPMEPYAASSPLPSRWTERHLFQLPNIFVFPPTKTETELSLCIWLHCSGCSIHSIGTSSRPWSRAACSHMNPCSFHLRLVSPGVIPVYCECSPSPANTSRRVVTDGIYLCSFLFGMCEHHLKVTTNPLNNHSDQTEPSIWRNQLTLESLMKFCNHTDSQVSPLFMPCYQHKL